MKIKTKGFSVIEFVMIVVVLAIVGTFVYFASKSKTVEMSNVKQPTPNTETVVIPNTLDTGATYINFGKMKNLAQQLITDAESRYNSNYKTVFTPSNSLQNNGAGILSPSGSIGKMVIDEANKMGGKIFVITNDKATAYAIYASNNSGRYYCLASDGSKSDDTVVVTSSKDLANKPICK